MRPRRRSSARIAPDGLIVWLGVSLVGCLTGQTVDLGTDVEPHGPDATAVAEASVPPDPEASAGDDASDRPDGTDEPPPAGAPLCIPNPSFESTTEDDAGPGPMLADPPQWLACSTPSTSSSACSLAPTDGRSYLGLSVGLAPLLNNASSVDATLCETLVPGVTYSLALDLGLDAPVGDSGPTSGEPPALQLRGSTIACDPNGEQLLTFSGVLDACVWKRICGSFEADQPYTHLVLIPETSRSTGLVFSQTHVLVDKLTSGGVCLPP
jgi:hypothetical protein